MEPGFTYRIGPDQTESEFEELITVICRITFIYEGCTTVRLTLLSLQTNTDSFGNNVDPDETARNEPSQSGATLFAMQLLPFDSNPHLQL